ncbi:DUF6518 family protein [Streptomyces sp. TRM70350]|uniref:DUF6518 family protein n=1 Tax=Streptomyces sp. TRM70350 TaxID=2856165 RepID=UPI001C47BC21|nr:DUF6518 family protein [Streptomyces sp. TRM70350]MBV7698376.1 hypothetical protein [Streptomyces sp. TRM70350]
MFSSRSFILALVAALTAGTAIGVLAPLLQTPDVLAAHVAHLVLAAGWSWGALAFCVGLARKSRIESAVLAPASLIAGVIVYYVTKLEQGQFLAADLDDPSKATHVYWAGFLSKTIFWCAAACVLGLILGLAGNLARNRGLRGLPFRVLIPLVVIVETSQRLRFEAPLQGAVASTTWSVARLVAVAVLIVLIADTVINLRLRRSAGQPEGRA